MADEPQFWSQRDAAREYTRLAAACEALFRAAGELAPQLAEPRATVAASTLSRRLGARAAEWRELVPESVLLADARASAPEVHPVAAEQAAVHEAIDALRRDLQALLARTSAVSDGAAERAVRATLADLDAGAPFGGGPPSTG